MAALPHTLQALALHIPMDEGLPMALEQLTSLEILAITNQGGGCMHLDRPLTPFLEMVCLESFVFQGDWEHHRSSANFESNNWTPDALRLLGMAQEQILQGHRPPGCVPLTLIYQLCSCKLGKLGVRINFMGCK